MKKLKLKIKFKNQTLKIISLITTIIVAVILLYLLYAFLPIQKTYKNTISDEQQWIAYIQNVNDWCGPTPSKLYIYEDGSYIIKKYERNTYEKIDTGKIKTLYNIENTINRLENKKKSKNKNYYIKFKSGEENTINLITNPRIAHYINKIPNIKKNLNTCK